MSHSNWNT